MARNAPKFNESPVFGLAGIFLPASAIRPFATRFLQLKEHLFKQEIQKSGIMSSHWEKKGIEIFTAKKIAKYKHFRSTGFRLINEVRNCGGHIFYYGREKIIGTTDVNSNGLHTTILSHTIRQLDRLSEAKRSDFIMILDQHSTKKQLLITASKTMFGQEPARRLISPPFEVESYINQNIQAADWIAAIVGRLFAYEFKSAEYEDHQDFYKYFHDRIQQVSSHSTILPRPKQPVLINN